MQTFEPYELPPDEEGKPIELSHDDIAVTYRAFDKDLRCQVALKVIKASRLGSTTAEEQLLREGRAAARLRQRNVASVFKLGKQGDTYYYAMELVDGETVERFVKRKGPINCLLALEIAEQVACALIAAEKRHLVHRDIKPANLVLVHGDGDVLVKVINFGLVKSAIARNASANGPTAGGFAGTPDFASPEQLEQRDEDIRSDIYSLGATLWYMLIGKPPFSGSQETVIAQQLDKSPPFQILDSQPWAVGLLLKRMLEKDVSRRFGSPAEMRGELLRCIKNLPGSAPARPVSSDEGHESSAVSSSGELSPPEPGVGSVIEGRYRLIEELNSAEPGRAFRAEDEQKRPVGVRILHADSAAFLMASREADLAKNATNPNFVKALPLDRDGDFGFIVLEWMEGFSLTNLVRARRKLTMPEVLKIVFQLAGAIDDAAKLQIKPNISLSGVFVQFLKGFKATSLDVLLNSPMEKWPEEWRAKIHVVAAARKLDLSTSATASATLSSDEKSAMVRRLATLTYRLLGGDPKNFISLPKLDSETSAVLGRGLTVDHGFSTATGFLEALKGARPSDSATQQPAVPPVPGAMSPAARPVTEGTGVSTAARPAESGPQRPIALSVQSSGPEIKPPAARPVTEGTGVSTAAHPAESGLQQPIAPSVQSLPPSGPVIRTVIASPKPVPVEDGNQLSSTAGPSQANNLNKEIEENRRRTFRRNAMISGVVVLAGIVFGVRFIAEPNSAQDQGATSSSVQSPAMVVPPSPAAASPSSAESSPSALAQPRDDSVPVQTQPSIDPNPTPATAKETPRGAPSPSSASALAQPRDDSVAVQPQPSIDPNSTPAGAKETPRGAASPSSLESSASAATPPPADSVAVNKEPGIEPNSTLAIAKQTPNGAGSPSSQGSSDSALAQPRDDSVTLRIQANIDPNSTLPITKQTRDAVLERIEMMPRLTEAEKGTLYGMVEKAGGFCQVLTINFGSGETTLSSSDVAQLNSAIRDPKISPFTTEPSAVFVVLGFADKTGAKKTNLKLAQLRADNVTNELKRCGVLNIIHPFSMGDTELLEPDGLAKNRAVEVWVALPPGYNSR